jgi:hypothetical protein
MSLVNDLINPIASDAYGNKLLIFKENDFKDHIKKLMKRKCQSPECCVTFGKGLCMCDSCRDFYNELGERLVK